MKRLKNKLAIILKYVLFWAVICVSMSVILQCIVFLIKRK